MSLHVTVEGKVFSVFSSTFAQAASKLVSMSASDKVTQWQVLGYQGALLSHFIEPVYVSRILIGKMRSLGHLVLLAHPSHHPGQIWYNLQNPSPHEP